MSRLDPHPSHGTEIGPARPDEVASLPEIERRAAALFPDSVLPAALAAQTTPEVELAEAQREGLLFVLRIASGDVIGFARLVRIDAGLHLEELDVDPAQGRRGHGRRLLETVCAWARDRGFPSITLSTFRDVPWNAPFYSSAGFRILAPEEWTSSLVQLRERERRQGLDVERRVLMLRSLARSESGVRPG